MIKTTLYFLLTLLLLFYLSSCAFKSINRTKNITYQQQTTVLKEQKLTVYAPRNHKQLKNVFIFVHGGNWNSGNKSLYSFFGSRLARKDVIAVIINYPLSPSADYSGMAKAVANSVKWAKENIEKYGGDPNRIFISGHSAGGHLAALVSDDNRYFDSLEMNHPVKGTILIDAAGLDMYNYLRSENLSFDDTYFKTFTHDPEQWKKATPIYYVNKNTPPMIIFRGGRTYPSIIESNEKYISEVRKLFPNTAYHIQKKKKHVPMIFQFLNPYNKHYKEIVNFMKDTK